MNRYLLSALPLSFTMACLMRSRPVMLALWLLVSGWQYWNVDLVTTREAGAHNLKVRNARHWVGRI